jgi:hypothetical protein
MELFFHLADAVIERPDPKVLQHIVRPPVEIAQIFWLALLQSFLQCAVIGLFFVDLKSVLLPVFRIRVPVPF